MECLCVGPSCIHGYEPGYCTGCRHRIKAYRVIGLMPWTTGPDDLVILLVNPPSYAVLLELREDAWTLRLPTRRLYLEPGDAFAFTLMTSPETSILQATILEAYGVDAFALARAFQEYYGEQVRIHDMNRDYLDKEAGYRIYRDEKGMRVVFEVL